MIFYIHVWKPLHNRYGKTSVDLDQTFFSDGRGNVKRTLSLRFIDEINICYYFDWKHKFQTVNVFKRVRICDV